MLYGIWMFTKHGNYPTTCVPIAIVRSKKIFDVKDFLENVNDQKIRGHVNDQKDYTYPMLWPLPEIHSRARRGWK